MRLPVYLISQFFSVTGQFDRRLSSAASDLCCRGQTMDGIRYASYAREIEIYGIYPGRDCQVFLFRHLMGVLRSTCEAGFTAHNLYPIAFPSTLPRCIWLWFRECSLSAVNSISRRYHLMRVSSLLLGV